MKVIRKPNRFYYLFNLLSAHTEPAQPASSTIDKKRDDEAEEGESSKHAKHQKMSQQDFRLLSS
jgi:hypothetical protein